MNGSARLVFGSGSPQLGPTRRALLRGGLAAGVALALAGCDFGKTYPPIRYKLTVIVDTPAGERRGFSVNEVTTGANARPVPFGWATNWSTFKGEAVAVDLPNGQTLFALLSAPGGRHGWAKGIWIGPMNLNTAYITDTRELLDLETRAWFARSGPMPISRGETDRFGHFVSHYPWLVRFRDVNDPTTAEVVDPDNLAASFGKGYKLRMLTVERTEEPITDQIEKRLVWLKGHKGSLAPASLNDSLVKRDFDAVTAGDVWTFGTFI